MCAALAGPDVEYLGDGDADGPSRDEVRLQVFRGKEKTACNQERSKCQGDHGSDVAVLINIGTDHTVKSKSDTKRQQKTLHQVGSQKLHSDQG